MRSATTWRPGESGNPAGPRREILEVREVRRLAQGMTLEMFKIVVHHAHFAEKEAVSLAAALAILKIAGLKMDGEVAEPAQTPKPRTDLPTARLLELARAPATTTATPGSRTSCGGGGS